MFYATLLESVFYSRDSANHIPADTKLIDVTAAIIEKNGLIFAARRRLGSQLGGYWEFPGGKIEAGETPEMCLARELYEEFKIKVAIGEFIGESIFDYGSKIVRLLAYRVEHLSGEFKLTDHDQLTWLAFEELFSVEWAPADIPIVQSLRASKATPPEPRRMSLPTDQKS